MTDSPSTTPLSDDELCCLSILAAMIIPASDEFNIPGADDQTILAEIVADAAAYKSAISELASTLNKMSQNSHADQFANLGDDKRQAIVRDFRQSRPAGLGLVEMLTVQCYYRDDRVMRSLDMEIRPPFPQGYELEQGDWSLLDTVRERPEFFRKTT